MNQTIFDSEFDIQKYIDKRILDIKDLEERKLLKDTLSHLFYEYYHYISNEYMKLEEKVFQEVEVDRKRFTIVTGLVSRKWYDETEETFFPMIPSDSQKKEILTQELVETIKEGCGYKIYSIFAKCDYLVIKKIAESKKVFYGTVKTKERDYRGTFHLEKNISYKKRIEDMYYVFLSNYIPWSTVCAPYVYKMFDVYIDTVDNFYDLKDILEIKVDFEEYQPYIYYDCIPVWNITEKREKTSSYPEPCINQIHYEHVIYSNRLEPNMDYLIGNKDIALQNIKKLDGDIVITCEESKPKNWILYKFVNKPLKLKEFFSFSNGVINNFSDVIHRKYYQVIKTKGELERYIKSLGYDEIISFADIYFQKEKRQSVETYEMDFFIKDEIRSDMESKTMIVEFYPIDNKNYFNRDIMSYLVSQIQKIFPEYLCVGMLKESIEDERKL